jgi:hypothetical protein
MDIDYLDQLSPKEAQFLDNVFREELNAYFKKDNSKNFVKSKRGKRARYHNNNARNRCAFGIARATGLLDEEYKMPETSEREGVREDAYIARIDRKARREKKKLLKPS